MSDSLLLSKTDIPSWLKMFGKQTNLYLRTFFLILNGIWRTFYSCDPFLLMKNFFCFYAVIQEITLCFSIGISLIIGNISRRKNVCPQSLNNCSETKKINYKEMIIFENIFGLLRAWKAGKEFNLSQLWFGITNLLIW